MEFTFKNIENNRLIFKKFLEELTVEQLNTIPEGFNNNIFWNIAHAMITSQLLCYKLSGLPFTIDAAWVMSYKKGTKPEKDITDADVKELKELLFATLEQLKQDYSAGKFNAFEPYTVSTNNSTLNSVDDALEFNEYHEGMHLGYILAQKKLV
ncbi:hypothetical protein NBRC110019_24310 [Neptunitalea chrysea]|uniref:DinB-like domain-containing protein n=1 Tax=Neptunitalea chrysea TaxID=1647581 RepID=A0A9W6EUE3_9FLAO|nr:DinB family protein [Neptunitalea chrysea]GLB53390.1 hypothetical protein NBRC110019_24310 [Neptunitalea chrysea]